MARNQHLRNPLRSHHRFEFHHRMSQASRGRSPTSSISLNGNHHFRIKRACDSSDLPCRDSYSHHPSSPCNSQSYRWFGMKHDPSHTHNWLRLMTVYPLQNHPHCNYRHPRCDVSLTSAPPRALQYAPSQTELMLCRLSQNIGNRSQYHLLKPLLLEIEHSPKCHH